MVNHYYFYCLDEDFGPFFLKFCTYFPYNAKLCINGHEYVKRQLAKEGIRLRGPGQWRSDDAPIPIDCSNSAMDSRPPRSMRCSGSGWAGSLTPSRPRIAQAGYRYDISILQAEFSLTQVLDRPLHRPRLLRGSHPREPRHRPARPRAIDLRAARHASRRRVGSAPACLTEGVTPSLHVDYKHAPDQAVSQGRPRLRTETTINNPHDFEHRQEAV